MRSAPAAGFVSTAGDLARYFAQLAPNAKHSVLSVASRREMTRRQWRNPHSSLETWYGLGIISGTLGGWGLVWPHRRALQGYMSRTVALPRQELTTIAVLTQRHWLGGWGEGVAQPRTQTRESPGKITLEPTNSCVNYTTMKTVATNPSVASPPDPPDQAGTAMPNNVGGLLHVARVLLGYGRHLLDTLRQRAAAPNFNSIAACFRHRQSLHHPPPPEPRTSCAPPRWSASCWPARRHRAAGHLYSVANPAAARHSHSPPQLAAEPEQPAAEPATRKAHGRPSSPTGWTNAEFFMPTPEDSRPPGAPRPDRPHHRRYLPGAILGVVPGFCTTHFWSDLLMVMLHYGGGLASVMEQERDHKKAFDKDEDRKPARNWDWLRMTSRDAPPPGPRLLHRRAPGQSAGFGSRRRHRHRPAPDAPPQRRRTDPTGTGQPPIPAATPCLLSPPPPTSIPPPRQARHPTTLPLPLCGRG